MIYVGKIVNTHGIKGEIRIKSDFKYKNQVFKKNFKIYIENEPHVINSYRVHKDYDMITIDNFNNINDVLKFKGLEVYVDRNDIEENLIYDLIGYKVYVENEYKGTVTEITSNSIQDILVIDTKYMVLNIPEFIESIDNEQKRINVKNIGGIFDEN